MRSSPLKIRPAQVKDAQLLARAERTIAATPGFLVSQPSEVSDERFVQTITALTDAEHGHYLVAENEEQVVGHGLLEPMPLAAIRHVVRLTLVVHPGYQGQGVGQALLSSLISWAQGAPAVEKIELNVRSSNTAAQALYLKMGFVEMGRWRRRVKLAPGKYVDDVAMERFVE